jgi:hypothetical protein
MSRNLSALVVIAALTACGGNSTDTGPLRYNFAVIAGKNQESTAGAVTLAAPITTELTRDKNGTFARGAFDFLLPREAFAQSLTMTGTPVAGALVCAREAQPGEPQAVPLCAFTLADGTAPIAIKGGTKAGTFVIAFTAQVQTQLPVKDSTTTIVNAGPVTINRYVPGITIGGQTPLIVDNGPGDPLVLDAFGNRVPYKLVPSGFVHVLSDTLGALSARTLVIDADGQGTIDVVTKAGVLSSGKITVTGAGSVGSTVIQLSNFVAK